MIILQQYIGRSIRKRRKELGITQAVLAELAEVSKNTVYKLECGISNPTVEVIEKLMVVLGLELIIRVRKV
ncbi:MAG: helix-turn-helix domain-containing protein [Bacteroidota bacterium]